jgi:hypothetical protein
MESADPTEMLCCVTASSDPVLAGSADQRQKLPPVHVSPNSRTGATTCYAHDTVKLAPSTSNSLPRQERREIRHSLKQHIFVDLYRATAFP